MDNKTTDIKSAFLQGKEIDHDVNSRLPAESHIPNNMIWKLKHGLYGLKDCARQFFISVKEELLKLELNNARWIQQYSIFIRMVI